MFRTYVLFTLLRLIRRRHPEMFDPAVAQAAIEAHIQDVLGGAL